MKNRGKLLRERASALLFSLPGRSDRRMVKLCCHWKQGLDEVGMFRGLSCPGLDIGEVVAMQVDA